MPTMDNLPGLAYKKLDLHVHTPASKCFRGECTPADIIRIALEKGFNAIAITDHNSGEWIDEVKKASKGTPLVVIPGVEISCTGGKKCIHIIGLFDPSAGTKNIEALLNILGVKPGEYGLEETITDKSPKEVVEIISDNGGLAVIAHANSSNGVLSDMSGQARKRTIQHPKLLAAESTDYFDEDKKKKRKRVIDLLDGQDPNYQRKLAVYQSSDNPCTDDSGQHCLEGIGSRYSYFKMEEIDKESLRQCFKDPNVRIKQEGELLPANYPRIKKVSINSGFLDGQEIIFHDGLTTILGAKGAGKSLLIEFMRFALNQEPNNPSIAQDHYSKLNSRLGEYGTVTVNYVDENGNESSISRTYRELDDSPYDDSVPYDPAQVFPVLFLSQSEIIKIAENESEQLEFIDQFFDFRRYRAKIVSIEKELESLDILMADGLRAYSEYESLSSKISTLDMEISKLDTALKNPIFERFQRIERKERALKEQNKYLSTFVESIDKAKLSILGKVAPDIPKSLEGDPALKRNLDLISSVNEAVEESLNILSQTLANNRDKAKIEYETWHPKYLEGKKKYEDYIQKMGGDYKAIALARERKVKQRNDLRTNLEAARIKKEKVPKISKERNELLDSLQNEYRSYTKERQQKCEKFQIDSQNKLELRIIDRSNVDEFRNSLLSLKRGSYLKDDEIGSITLKVNPRDFVMSLIRYDATKKSEHLGTIANESGIELQRTKTLADFLLSAIPFEELLALQYKAQPRDRPDITYDIGEGKFQPLAEVSVGQKCTAMQLMALSDGTMPIVIDQPEDSLDIRSIWDDMCTKIRDGKEKRQFIFTTHNSSLAVASDTDCYLVLEGDAANGKLVHLGAMDHPPLNSEVMKYLEGGKDTYLMKYEKYRSNVDHTE